MRHHQQTNIKERFLFDCSQPLYVYLPQHPFIDTAKAVTVLNSMIQEALNIMEEESTREENEVGVVNPVGNVPPPPTPS